MDISAVSIALDIMKQNGLKYTKKREEILDYLSKENRYLSAKELQIHLKKDFPGISFDTIYRNLNDFERLELLEKIELDGEMRYRISCRSNHHHHHFICNLCGKTREIDYCPMEEIYQQLGQVEVEGHRFEIFGKCESCIS
ncbi:MAG: transcriptional repressor [Streptococcaceae bacterium]|jgi:Fur family zinc uptake transcriptional regulator|nr:transcriptional repressor [Streptococcaceae bacterium]